MVLIIILLILCLPLILMLGLFTTTNVVAVVADVPVSGIELHMDKEEIYEIDVDRGEVFAVDYTVMPQGATNKAVFYTFFDASTGEEVDAFDVEGNVIIPKMPGKFDVYVNTVGGPYRDGFRIYVTTSRVTGIECTIDSEVITVGKFTDIRTKVTPQNAQNQAVTYTVKSGTDVVEIVNGRVKGIGVGTAVIEISSVENPDIKDEVTVTVESSGVFDFVNDNEYTTVLETGGTIDLVVNPYVEIDSTQIELVSDSVADPHSVLKVVYNSDTNKLEYEFIDPEFVGDITVNLTVTSKTAETVTKSCKLSRVTDIEVSWVSSSSKGAVHLGDQLDLHIDVRPSGADITYRITVDFTKRTDISGDVNPGVEITLEQGRKYTCNGGYISFMLVGNTIVVYGEKTDDVTMLERTSTVISIVVTDNVDGKVITLPKKTIIVQP